MCVGESIYVWGHTREDRVVSVAFRSQLGYFSVQNNASLMFNMKLFCCGGCHSESH